MKLNSNVTISSREIAELTGKHHAHVMASIRKDCKVLDFDGAAMLSHYIDRQGKPRPCYLLDAYHATVLFPSKDMKKCRALLERLKELQEAAEAPEISSFADEFAAALESSFNTTPSRLPMSGYEVSQLVHVGHAYATDVAAELITELSKKNLIIEGEDWEWEPEYEDFYMTEVLGCFIAERLNPEAHYRVMKLREAGAKGVTA